MTSIACPWCGQSVEVKGPDKVPAYPQGFKFDAPCCDRPFIVTRYAGRLHVQRFTAVATPAPAGLPS